MMFYFHRCESTRLAMMKKDKENKRKDKQQQQHPGIKGKNKQDPKGEEDKSKIKPQDDEAENQGFSFWLRSSEGFQMMRLFVIANSLVVFVTIGWPSMKEAINVIHQVLAGLFN